MNISITFELGQSFQPALELFARYEQGMQREQHWKQADLEEHARKTGHVWVHVPTPATTGPLPDVAEAANPPATPYPTSPINMDAVPPVVVKRTRKNKTPASPNVSDANAGAPAVATAQLDTEVSAGVPDTVTAHASVDNDSADDERVDGYYAGADTGPIEFTPEQVRDALSKLRDSGKLPNPGALVKACVVAGSISKATVPELAEVMKRIGGL